MDISTGYVGVRRVLRQVADRLVKGDLRKRARVDVAQHVFTILQVLRAISSAGRKPCKIIEWLVVRLEIAAFHRVDHLSWQLGRLSSIRESQIPPPGIPGPVHSLR